MKKSILLLPLFFLFFQKIDGQVEPRLVQQVVQVYSDSLEMFLDSKQLLYEYDSKGNVISETEINFDNQGEIISWEGKLKEFDTENLLIKETDRRYNWEVGIWITNDWIEFFYDENGCLVERKIVPNIASVDFSIQKIDHDNECQELGYISEREDGSLVGTGETRYTDEGNRIFAKNYFYIEAIDSLFYMGGLLRHINEEKDEIELFDYLLWGSGRFFENTHHLFEHDYQFGTNGILESKNRNTYDIVYHPNYNIHNPLEIYLDTFLSEVATIDYYYCQDVLVKEEIDFEQFDIDGNSFLGKRRVLYFYEGEDRCFDFENKSTASVYPNPTSGNIQIESPLLASGNTQIKVIDINGKIMLEKLVVARKELVSLNIGHLANGTYVLQLLSGEHFISKKIVIVK